MCEMMDSLFPRFTEEHFGMLFLGDYVDRGLLCIEVMAYMMALKINYPKRVVMLRGNHESRQMTQYFTFRQECLQKYDEEIYESFMTLFDCLPLVCTVNGLYLCMHGGIGPDFDKLEDVNGMIDRFQEPPNMGLMCDLLWADPLYDNDEAKSSDFMRN